ncbi:MAG: hypothetical protein WDN29_03505 [Methylovirgula sp.]
MRHESENPDVVGDLRAARNRRDQDDRRQDNKRYQSGEADRDVSKIKAAQQKLYRQRGAVPIIDMRKNVEDINKRDKRIDRAENINDGGRRRIKNRPARFFSTTLVSSSDGASKWFSGPRRAIIPLLVTFYRDRPLPPSDTRR